MAKITKYTPDALKYLGYSDEFAYAVKRGDNILAATNARGKTVWLAEGNERWGWNHIVKNRIEAKNGNQFLAFGDEYTDVEKCKSLVMETVEKGTYINKPGSSEAFIMQVNDKYSLKVAYNEHGSINTAFTMPNEVAEKEIRDYGV
jgi:hypothetical protein